MAEPQVSRSQVAPFFLEGPAGRLFAALVTPSPPARTTEAVLYVPPFAEEMNRSRRMATLQAQRLAEKGVAVLLLDLFGTGESEGDFHDARWSIWLEDIAVAVHWLRGQGYRSPSLWGLRLGALLASEAAVRMGDVGRIILWQPVLSGDTFLTQFLRIRVAAGMDRAAGETTSTLKSALMDGRSVEVAGYELAPDLARALSAARIEALPLPSDLSVHWLEVVAEPDGPPAPASRRILQTWRDRGIPLTVETVSGEPFWALQEITLAPNLLEPTVQALEFAADDRDPDRLCLSGR